MNNNDHTSSTPQRYPHVVLQWNCRSVISKKSEIIHLINIHDPSIIALAETWLRPGYTFKIKGYTCIRDDRSDGYGGVALLVKQNLYNIKRINITPSSNFSIVAILVFDVCFVSIYIPYPSSQTYLELSNILNSLPKPICILGDFNTQHRSWGSSISSVNSDELLDIIDNHNLCVLNTGSSTRITGPNENLSAIDLSIVSASLASTLSWKTLSSSHGSDHYPILITFPGNKPKQTPTKPFFKYRIIQNKWPDYKLHIENNINTLPESSHHEISKCSSSLTHLILKAVNSTFPSKKTPKGKLPSPPWWDSQCTEAIKLRKKAERDYKNNMSEDNFNKLLSAMSNTKKLFKEKKFMSWRQYCTSISPRTPTAQIWNKIKCFRLGTSESTGCRIPPSLCNEFLNNLAPSFVPEHLSSPCLPSDNTSDYSFLNSPFSLDELKGVLSGVQDTAPGEDGIPYSFFSHLGDNSLKYYLEVINIIFLTGDIPTSWKSHIILPVHKPNKDPTDILSYRPIALAPVILKIAENLIKIRLEWFLENRNLLPCSQYGFRKGKSTLDSIGILVSDVRLAFTTKQSVVAAFLDIKSAYDNVVLSILKNKLEFLKVPYYITNFIMNSLYGRLIKLDSLSRKVWKGLPQGSVLSPILYNVYTYDLDNIFKGTPVSILQYADDIAVYISNKCINSACSSLSASLNTLKKWLNDNGLELSVSKSCTVLFTRQRMPPPLTVYYDGIPIKAKTHTKFLGLIMDSKLNGISHCDYIADKCERSLNILRCLAGVWWGAHPLSLKLIYNAIIRSVIDYGSFLLEPCSAAAMKRLDAIQTKALRIITGAMKSSPINALQVECADPPLQLRRQYLADRFFFRILQSSEHPLIEKLQLISETINKSDYWKNKTPPHLIFSFLKFKALNSPTHRSPKLPLFETDYRALILSPDVHNTIGIEKDNPSANTHFKSVICERWTNWHYIYCDASKHSNNDFVGVGLYHQQYKIVEKVKFPPETSIFTAECYGIYKALEYILIFKLTNSVVFSDSKSALSALSRFPFKKNCECTSIIVMARQKLLDCVESGYSVSFVWIPSHSNIVGNEIADRLANEATGSGDLYPFKNYTQDLVAISRVHLIESWREDWKNSTQIKGKYYHSVQPDVLTRPWFSKVRLGKRATSMIIRLRLGHMCNPAHLARIRVIDSSACECGEDVCDANHMILNCPLFDRTTFNKTLSDLKISFPTNIQLLLRSNLIPVYKSLATFLENNNIKL